MAKKIVKQLPHLRIRIDPKLVARLEKIRETNGHTLTGEIVSRLEGSFAIADATALTERFLKEQIARLEKQNEDLTERLNLAGEIHAKDAEQFRMQAAVMEAQTKLFDALVGNAPATKTAIRALALHFAANPRWHETPNLVSQMALHAGEIIKAAAQEDEQ